MGGAAATVAVCVAGRLVRRNFVTYRASISRALRGHLIWVGIIDPTATTNQRSRRVRDDSSLRAVSCGRWRPLGTMGCGVGLFSRRFLDWEDSQVMHRVTTAMEPPGTKIESDPGPSRKTARFPPAQFQLGSGPETAGRGEVGSIPILSRYRRRACSMLFHLAASALLRIAAGPLRSSRGIPGSNRHQASGMPHIFQRCRNSSRTDFQTCSALSMDPKAARSSSSLPKVNTRKCSKVMPGFRLRIYPVSPGYIAISVTVACSGPLYICLRQPASDMTAWAGPRSPRPSRRARHRRMLFPVRRR